MLSSLWMLAWTCALVGEPNDHTFSIFWENDAFARSDRHYTQGAGLAYLSPDLSRPAWLLNASSCLPAAGITPEGHKLGWAITQEIYTPEDLRASQVVADERPYAGWLFTSLFLQRRGPGWFNRPAMDVWGLDLGVVGPPSLAEQTQRTWHDADPNGWAHQLKTEVAFALFYERSSLWRWPLSQNGWSFDFIPFWGAAAGTLEVDARIGSRFTLGYNVPDTFVVPAQGRQWGLFLFGGFEGRWVLRNLFLDGNTFRASHRVDKEPWVGELHLGVSLVLKRLQLTARQTLRSDEFQGQSQSDTFSAAYISYKF